MSHNQQSVTAEPLVRVTVDTLPAAPALLALARFRYAPKARFGPAAGPGPVAFLVESGSLSFSAERAVSLRRGANGGSPESPPPNKEFTIEPGDEVLIPGNVVHAVRNTGSSPATILGAATFPGGGPPKSFPDGVDFQPLVMSMVSTLASAPAEYAVQRVTYAPGSRDPETYYSGPGLYYVESGTPILQVIAGDVQIVSDPAGGGQPETVKAGHEVQLSKGQGVSIPAGAVVSLGNTSSRPAVVLSLRTGPAFSAAAIDIRQVLPNFVHSVMDAANPAAVARFLDPTFFSHDLPPASTALIEKQGDFGVANFLKTTIFPAFSGFETKFPTLISDGDLVAGHWVQSFQHTGDGYFGARATGRPVTIDGFTIVRVKDGKIVEHWEQRDIGTWHRKIGLGFPLGPLESRQGTVATVAAVTDPNKRVVAEYFSAWNTGARATLDRVLSPEFRNNQVIEGQLPGREGIAQLMEALRSSLGGFRVTVDLLVSDGSGTVFSRVRYSGRHQATLFGVPPTGRDVEFAAIDLFTVRNGVIVERWGQLDESSLAMQLGVLQPPGGP